MTVLTFRKPATKSEVDLPGYVCHSILSYLVHYVHVLSQLRHKSGLKDEVYGHQRRAFTRC